jgi:hypothetical protein
MVSFGGQSTFDNAQSEAGVAHESVYATDHDDASVLRRGYDYSSFSETSADPVHCWPLQEDSGSIAYDIVNEQGGSTSGATVGATGILETTAYDFDGNDDYIEMETGILEGLSEFSVMAWVNLDTIGSGSVESRIFASDNSNVFHLLEDADNDRYMFEFNDGGTWHTANGGSPSTDVWTFLAATYDSSDLRFYVDGTEVYSSSVSATTNSPTEKAYIGCGNDGGGPSTNSARYLDGRVTEVRTWHAGLSASDVRTLYNVGDKNGSLKTQPQTL